MTCIFKRMISAVLTVIMLFSVMSASLTVSAATVSEKESNDTYATANSLTPGNSVNGVISSRDDVDYYKIVPTANGKFTVDFLHTYADNNNRWNVVLYRYADGTYNEISNYSIMLKGNEKVSLPMIGAVKNGVYYILVKRYNYDTGVVGVPYTLQTSFTASAYYEKEVNDVYSSATDITLDNTYHGTINRNQDKDYYRIKPSSNGMISIDFLHTYADSGDRWHVLLYRYADGKYSELSNYAIRMNGNEKISLPFIGAVKDGIYYICVQRFNYDSAVVGVPYSLQIALTASDYYEKEVNDVYSAATPASINQTYGGVLNSNNDKDCYKAVAPLNGKLTISFSHDYYNSTDAWNVEVYRYYDGAYTRIANSRINRNSENTQTVLSVSAKKGDIYFAVVTRYSYSDITGKAYSLKFAMSVTGLSTLSATASTSAVKLTWKKVSGASGYQVQRKVSGAWKNVANTTAVTYTVKSLKAGTVYNFRVRAFVTVSGTKFYSGWKAVNMATKPDKPAIKTPTTDAKHRIKVKWKSVSAGSGYYVQVSTDKAFKKIVKTQRVSNKASNNVMINKLKKGVRYYVRVRAYKNYDSEKSYSAWSSIKNIVCK